MHGAVLAAGAAVAASLLVIARRRWQRDDDVPSSKPAMPSVETKTPAGDQNPVSAETPRKALLGGDDELWEEQQDEHGKSRRRPRTPPPLIHHGLSNTEEALAVEEAALEEVARLKAQLEQLAFKNESLHNLNESLNESLHKAVHEAGEAAKAAERERGLAPVCSPGMLTGATEGASSVDRAPL